MGKLIISTDQYCSQGCQKTHWPTHRKDCRSPLTKQTWQPTWKREQRAQVQEVDARRLWSDCHAIDIIKLDENEGSDFQGPFDILITGILPFKLILDVIDKSDLSY